MYLSSMLKLKFQALLLATIFIVSGYLFSEDNRGFATSNSTEPIQDSNSTNISDSKVSFQNATKYELIKTWGSEGKGEGQFQRPHDLDFSPDEKILYSVDRDGNRIQAFD